MKNEKVAFVFVGSGPHKEDLLQQARRDNLKNAYFLEPISKTQIPALLKYFEVAYLGWHAHPLYRFGISPNKLMDYMMAARPILHAVAAGNDPVREAGCGMTIEPDNPEAAVRGIRTLLALPANERREMGQRGKAFVLKNLTYPILGKRFLDAYALL